MSPHYEKLKDILISQMGVTEDSIQLQAELGRDLSLDSLDCEELLMILEEEFDIKIPSSEFRHLEIPTTTVKNLTDYLDKAA